MRLLLTILTVLAAVGPAMGDRLFLKDGRSFSGTMVSNTAEKVVFESDSGGIKMRMEFRPSEVDRVVKEDLPTPTTVKTPTTKPAAPTPKGGEPKAPAVVKYDKPTYYLIPVRGEIGRQVQATYLQKAFEDAAQRKPDCVVLAVDSPGGLINEVGPIVDVISKHQSKVRCVVLVKRALSAAAISSLACKEIYMQPTATFGAATAFQIGASGLPQDIDEKLRSIWRATGRSAAEAGDHSPLLAEAMIEARMDLHVEVKDGKKVISEGRGNQMVVTQGKLLTMTAKEAESCGLAVGVVDDVEVLGKVLGHDGWVECKGLGTLLADYNEKMLAEGEAQMKDLKQDFEEAMKQARVNDPSQFNYFVRENGKFTSDSAKKWQERSATCARFLARAETAIDKAAKVAEKYPQLAADSERLRGIKSEINEIRQRIQKQMYRRGRD